MVKDNLGHVQTLLRELGEVNKLLAEAMDQKKVMKTTEPADNALVKEEPASASPDFKLERVSLERCRRPFDWATTGDDLTGLGVACPPRAPKRLRWDTPWAFGMGMTDQAGTTFEGEV